MKMIIVVALALVAAAAAAPAAPAGEPIPILRSDFDQTPEGGYNYGYETGNGINYNEQGQLKEVVDEENKPHSVIVVRGSYSYPDEDGKPISITYFADETGFHAEGERVPKPARR